LSQLNLDRHEIKIDNGNVYFEPLLDNWKELNEVDVNVATVQDKISFINVILAQKVQDLLNFPIDRIHIKYFKILFCWLLHISCNECLKQIDAYINLLIMEMYGDAIVAKKCELLLNILFTFIDAIFGDKDFSSMISTIDDQKRSN
jgi:hypothetical protein